MLLCGIINELQEKSTDTSLAYFFCQATDSNINNATAVLRGLLYLLIDQQPSLISHIQQKYEHAGRTLFEDSNAWIAVSEIFSDILQDPGLRSVYLFVDALDECITDLPRLLKFVAQHSSAPSRVKWIVSSRNWPAIEEELEKAGHKVRLSLELNAESVSTAVGIFIRHKVSQLAQSKSYDPETQAAVLKHLVSNANDTFLWVALVCQNLQGIPRRNVLKRLTAFPPGLDSLYERMMQQISSTDDADLCKQVLAVLAIVYQPVTLVELTALVEELDDITNTQEKQEIINLCGSFLTLREDTIYFIHQSAKDFLLSKASTTILPSGSRDIHCIILSRSLQAMSRTLCRDMYGLGALGYPAEQVKLPFPDPLAMSRYSCIYWIDHLCNSIPNPPTDHDISIHERGAVDEFIRKKYLYWLEALSLCKRMSKGVVSMAKLEALVRASLTQVTSYVCRLLTRPRKSQVLLRYLNSFRMRADSLCLTSG
jgi:hypothetical protein